ncbi:MAG: beta-galactosidase GalB [Ginsengibacter sp.]
MIRIIRITLATTLCFSIVQLSAQDKGRISFNNGWKFKLDSTEAYNEPGINDANWRTLNLPHDWSIEFPFDSTSPTGVGGGALRGGMGWYRKTFILPQSDKGKNIFIDFDGVYRQSEVWINGHSLGMRPSGYISFRYDLTPYLNYGTEKNVIAVKVDNLRQPNSRWYSGSGIYRNVWLVKTSKIYVDHWGTFITTPQVSSSVATVHIITKINNQNSSDRSIILHTILLDAVGKQVASSSEKLIIAGDKNIEDKKVVPFGQNFKILQPKLWSVDAPYLYKAVSQVIVNGNVADTYETTFGIRYFNFDSDKGFSLNGKSLKILGVCDHHDLGALGTAFNTRAAQRQLEILKAMGCNGIRTSHNPPAPELLDLCDKMGFIVMDEAFDMWKKQKTPYDYHLDWDQWHVKDLQDQLLRDRNHPSVFIWSIGNEIPEQWDRTGTAICSELVSIVKQFDTTRPTVSALNNPRPSNWLVKANALDIIGFNYEHKLYTSFRDSFPGQKFLATETVSALATRGYYDRIPFDSIRRWPDRWDKPFEGGNKEHTISAYDQVSAPWGSLHEETWKYIKKYPYLSGEYIWTGFDYIGEPTPFGWPSRSSYFGIIDIAGFPKDVYYMYQSEWTTKPVLHLFPHWNWNKGDTIDVISYYNNADEVTLFLNGKFLGTKHKTGDDLHVKWRVPYKPGTLKAVSKKAGKIVLTKEVKTAGAPAKLILHADRNSINADGNDLSFITVTIVDKDGTIVPEADNLIQFKINGEGFLAGVDSGSETSLESFKGDSHTALNGLALAILQSNGNKGSITLTASANGLGSSAIRLEAK